VAVRGGKGLNRELGEVKITSEIPGHKHVMIKKKIVRILSTTGRRDRLEEEPSME
jgi:hypothetical protein